MSKKKQPRLHNDGQPYISFNHMKRECKKMAARYVATKDQLEALQSQHEQLLNKVQTMSNLFRIMAESIDMEVEEYE